MKESFYVSQWCRDDFGKQEFVLWDNTRVDCLTKDYAIEFDFAKKMGGKYRAVFVLCQDDRQKTCCCSYFNGFERL